MTTQREPIKVALTGDHADPDFKRVSRVLRHLLLTGEEWDGPQPVVAFTINGEEAK